VELQLLAIRLGARLLPVDDEAIGVDADDLAISTVIQLQEDER
jgi:hypothetical protein